MRCAVLGIQCNLSKLFDCAVIWRPIRFYKIKIAKQLILTVSILREGLLLIKGEAGGAESFKTKRVVPYLKQLPTRRKANFRNVTSDALQFSLLYDDSNPHGVPEAEEGLEIGSFEVSGIQSVITR